MCMFKYTRAKEKKGSEENEMNIENMKERKWIEFKTKGDGIDEY